MTAILVIGDIPNEYKDYILKATFTLWKIQGGVLKEIGINGNQFIKPIPERQPESARRFDIEMYNTGWNDCLDEIMRGEE